MKRSDNKKRLAALIVLLLAVAGALIAFAAYVFAHSGKSDAPAPVDAHPGDAAYEMEITPYYAEGALHVRQTVTFQNGGQPLDRLVFCLPLNAYRRAVTAPLDADAFDAAFPEAYAPGGIEFTSITLDGRSVEWGVSGSSEAILTVLAEIVPGQQVSVGMEYHAVLPEFAGADGFDDGEWRMSGFYPCLAQPDGGEWRAYAPAYVGQYLCAPVGDYSITLHAPSDFDIAATGSAAAQESADGWTTWRIEARDAREVSIVMRRGGCVYEREVNGAHLRVYGRDRLRARQALDTAAAFMECMDDLLPYPYPALEIVLGDYAGPDRSATGLILMNAAAPDFDAQLAYLIARQWWGGIVGCDPVEEPWLSEALAQFSALSCVRAVSPRSYAALREVIDSAVSMTLPGGLNVETGSAAFTAQSDYDNVLRYRGAAVLELLSEALDGRLPDVLSDYARACAYGMSTRDDLLAALSRDGSGDWSAWLSETLQGIGRAG